METMIDSNHSFFDVFVEEDDVVDDKDDGGDANEDMVIMVKMVMGRCAYRLPMSVSPTAYSGVW